MGLCSLLSYLPLLSLILNYPLNYSLFFSFPSIRKANSFYSKIRDRWLELLNNWNWEEKILVYYYQKVRKARSITSYLSWSFIFLQIIRWYDSQFSKEYSHWEVISQFHAVLYIMHAGVDCFCINTLELIHANPYFFLRKYSQWRLCTHFSASALRKYFRNSLGWVQSLCHYLECYLY